MLKNHLLSLLVVVLSSTALFAQPDKKMVDEVLKGKKIDADTSKKGPWKFGGIFSVNLNQQTSSYWVGTSEDFAFTVGAAADLYANMEKKKKHWDNTLKMSYAFQDNQSQGRRKTSDFIDLYSKYGVNINDSGTLSASILANIRTQFTDGYDYDVVPKRRTSGFFAPATILITPGLDWRPTKYFSLFFSPIAAKFVLVTNQPYSYNFPGGIKPDGSMEQPISELYGVDPSRRLDFQFGAFLSASFSKELLKNVLYSSRLDLYSNYLRKPGNIDIFWTNNLAFKLNKWLAITYQWNIAYDDDYVPTGLKGPRTQFLGILGIGVTAKF